MAKADRQARQAERMEARQAPRIAAGEPNPREPRVPAAQPSREEKRAAQVAVREEKQAARAEAREQRLTVRQQLQAERLKQRQTGLEMPEAEPAVTVDPEWIKTQLKNLGYLTPAEILGTYGPSEPERPPEELRAEAMARFLEDPSIKYGEEQRAKRLQEIQDAFSKFREEPGYAYGLSESEKAIRRNAAATGMLGSGAVQKAISENAQNYADQAWQNFYNRNLGQIAAADAAKANAENTYGNYYARLAGLSGQGQQAVAQSAQSGMSAAQQLAQSRIAGGNARASQYAGGGTDWGDVAETVATGIGGFTKFGTERGWW